MSRTVKTSWQTYKPIKKHERRAYWKDDWWYNGIVRRNLRQAVPELPGERYEHRGIYGYDDRSWIDRYLDDQEDINQYHVWCEYTKDKPHLVTKWEEASSDYRQCPGCPECR